MGLRISVRKISPFVIICIYRTPNSTLHVLLSKSPRQNKRRNGGSKFIERTDFA